MRHASVWQFAGLSLWLLACSSEDAERSDATTTWTNVAGSPAAAGAPAPAPGVPAPTTPAPTAMPPPTSPPAAGTGADLPMMHVPPIAGAPAPEPPAELPMAGAAAPDPDPCSVQPITDELREIHGEVYTRYASAHGVPVLATDSPQDEAMRRACTLLLDLGQRPEILATMLQEHIGLVVMGVDETSADFPEFAAWGVPDSRARGLGGVPRGLCAEENVMCDTARDRWRGESICVHEFAHTMHLGVYNVMDDGFDDRVEAAYRAATGAGLFEDTYAGSNAVEYFGEGVQDWYDTNLQSTPPNGIHNAINTREELKQYDPALYDLLAEVLPDQPGYQDCYHYE